MNFNYDVIVVGAGHAGCEAASIAAKLGGKTLLITSDITKIAQLSCNPAVGGVAKGQIVAEIDALGGVTGRITEENSIQFRMLNKSKGPAMWSPRSQVDKEMFGYSWKKRIEKTDNLDVWQDTVLSVEVDRDKNKECVIKSVTGQSGLVFFAKSVILTNGTFLNGKVHIGVNNYSSGRIGEPPVLGLTASLEKIGFESGRMKTGTPVRIDIKSLDLKKGKIQYGDYVKTGFVFKNSSTWNYFDFKSVLKKQLPCYIFYTKLATHEVLKKGFKDSPLFNKVIKGVGPRYCPSIEDKIKTFESKNEHQLFLEPEGLNNFEYYLNGFSSSLPLEIQIEALKTIDGFENVQIIKPGYAIEYDYFLPTQLKNSLETKLVKGLFFAGQINGTTGYEEAAGQGLVAGINAYRSSKEMSPFVVERNEGYIGVLISDLVTKGVDEPYRMFTSRAEYRLLLRHSYTDLRLLEKGKLFGLISEEYYKEKLHKKESIDKLKSFILENSFDFEKKRCNTELGDKTGISSSLNSFFDCISKSQPKTKTKLGAILLRPEVSIYTLIATQDVLKSFVLENGFTEEVISEVEIVIKYANYIEKEKEDSDRVLSLKNIKIPLHTDYNSLLFLTIEARQKLSKVRPETVGDALLIPGVSPADISNLLVKFGR